MERLGVLSVLESFAVLATSGLAAYSIVKWRREMLENRKYDAAVEFHVAMLEARSIFSELNSNAPYRQFLSKANVNTKAADDAGAIPYHDITYSYFNHRRSQKERLYRAVLLAKTLLDERVAQLGDDMLGVYNDVQDIYNHMPQYDINGFYAEWEVQAYTTLSNAQDTADKLVEQCRVVMSAYFEPPVLRRWLRN